MKDPPKMYVIGHRLLPENMFDSGTFQKQSKDLNSKSSHFNVFFFLFFSKIEDLQAFFEAHVHEFSKIADLQARSAPLGGAPRACRSAIFR